MEKVHFIGDENKNQKNIKAHDISFDEAKTVFFDKNVKIRSDPDHATEEDCFIIGGLSTMKREKREALPMRTEYDFSKANPNPYIKKVREQITITRDRDTLECSKKQAEKNCVTDEKP